MSLDNLQPVLVTGASGFIGWNLSVQMRDRGLSPVLLINRYPLEGYEQSSIFCDLTSIDQVKDVVQRVQPKAVIHCAAQTQAGECETNPGAAEQINVHGTRNLLEALEGKSRFLFLSTDLVFDGNRGNYQENDEPRPLSVYAQTKYRAEELVKQMSPNHVVVRTTLTYGENSPVSGCFLQWMHEGCRQGRVTLFEDEYRSPIYVGDLTDLLIRLIDADYSGILHAGGPQRLSRSDFGSIFCDVFGYSHAAIEKKKLSQLKVSSYRPADVSLDISRAQKYFSFDPRDVRSGLEATRTVSDPKKRLD